MKLNLDDVTLVLASSVCPELCEMSLNTCLDHAEFGEIIVASDNFLVLHENYRFFHAEFNDVEAYCDWLLHELPSKLRTKHFLVVQWDSWIINPAAWRPEFLEYDYIGAPWQHRLVEEHPDVARRRLNNDRELALDCGRHRGAHFLCGVRGSGVRTPG